MSSRLVRTTFQAALTTAYPALALVEVKNTVIVPPKDQSGKSLPFMGVFYLATEEPLGIGPGCWRETGTINVVIYALAGRGDPDEAADAIRNLFGGKDLPVVAPGVRLALLSADPLTGYMGGSQPASGVYVTGMVAISYQYDFNR